MSNLIKALQMLANVVIKDPAREHLKACLDWMEQFRASGDAGNWEWTPDDAYTKARAFLEDEN